MNNLLSTASRSILNTARTIKMTGIKHAPEIAFVVGAVGIVAAGVVACRATLKLDDINQERKADLARIEEAEGNVELINEHGYTTEVSSRDKVIVNIRYAKKLAIAYGPSVMLGAASLGVMFYGHNILKNRYMMMATAYNTLSGIFGEYRSRVVDKYGREEDQYLRYGFETTKVTETTVDPETGVETSVEKTVKVSANGVDSMSGYFDRNNLNWKNDDYYSKAFLRQQQKHWNYILDESGFVFLNEVRAGIGLERVKDGQLLGWRKGNGTYIDFGITDMEYEGDINWGPHTLHVEFNVQGDIWTDMKK